MTAVITGMGLFTPVGRGVEATFDALCTGRSGLVQPPADHPIAGSLEVAGVLPAIDPRSVASGPDTKILDRIVLLALLTAAEAFADAGIEVGRDVAPERAAVIVGGVGGMATLEAQVLTRAARGRAGVNPYLLTGILPNMPSARIAIRHGIRGYSSSVGTACASGVQAVADAVRLIQAGEADVVLCGASEAPLFPTFADTFGNARALARGWADPTAASRPFDTRRNGFVLAEGAALLVLESADHAAARGATGYAEIAGYGVTTDAYHPTAPRPDGTGAAESIRRALAGGGVPAAEVGYVNAHGTGTKLGDIAEITALTEVFGPNGVPVSSTKALTGHLLGASGVLEAAATALALGRGLLPPTWNLDDPDPACAADHIRKDPRATETGYALTNSFGFGGQNVSLLLARSRR
ncbi:beta-ketoacyl-[acyl-carrier-protein] synthase family protein [Salinispora arenicola]|uniref:3-oxoacyl-[acyl-carrier-protein] synthase II n=1 Tax=Salinispora arenicola TaxID=168697 RepID=A0A542XRP3_SALAC|nr:beta-ketoacyl-[acyl-carrier-protein] synthase family protein [Salinispora arenicola]MCN0150982.1 beta-ketoacyl-[acyl-carrier-protein] synthase family protein [Salinispora arenicola]TQL38491.1 3-oxoacyl-[acyl-carrier-protein] synthase II [Salinispora arenicola]GIM84515.1 beta-ketoacyl-[acyl-carrier-protein] synthase II [Salinispora arenicola]